MVNSMFFLCIPWVGHMSSSALVAKGRARQAGFLLNVQTESFSSFYFGRARVPYVLCCSVLRCA